MKVSKDQIKEMVRTLVRKSLSEGHKGSSPGAYKKGGDWSFSSAYEKPSKSMKKQEKARQKTAEKRDLRKQIDTMEESSINEKAPPGEKYEKMIKGMKDEGMPEDKIYAIAWSRYNKDHGVNESTLQKVIKKLVAEELNKEPDFDPVGKTEKGKKVGVGQIRDIDNDGDVDDEDSYLAYRRKKITQNIEEQADGSSHEAVELYLYINNDGELYERMYLPIIKNLLGKEKKGVYNSSRALKAFYNLANAGAKKYTSEHGSPDAKWHNTFSTSDRKEAAKDLLDDFEAEYL